MQNDLNNEELYSLSEKFKFNIFERINLSIRILILAIFFSISNIIFKNFFFPAIIDMYIEFYRELEKNPDIKNELKQIHNKVAEKESRKTIKYSKLIEELGIQRK
jgi:hypothetical protein